MRFMYYINVGNLPKLKAEAYARQCGAIVRRSLLRKHEKMIIIPIKEGDTRLEKID